MFEFIDKFLNGITMYKLMLYFLWFLFGAALALSLLGILPYSPASLIFSAAVLVFACYFSNLIFASIVKVAANAESSAITGFILSLIITPVRIGDWRGLWFLLAAAVFSQASKYIFAYQKKHIFNPAAFGVAATFYLLHQGASWWVGAAPMVPFIAAGGLLILRKIQRFQMLGTFLATVLGVAFLVGGPIIAFSDISVSAVLRDYLLRSPLLFFATVMFPEPLTSPTKHKWRLVYALIVGLLFALPINFGSFYFTPELSLLVGNIFSFAVSSKGRYILTLKQKQEVAYDTVNFIFESDKKLRFQPGQYLEWTLGHGNIDKRGNRRFFTVASSPTENNVILGTKFYPNPSSFKKSLRELPPGAKMNASQLSGDFVMPEDKNRKLAFLAGGIGITPFRSMIKYLLDKNEKRDIVVLYSNKTEADVAYKDILDEAQNKLGIKTVYVITDKTGFVTGGTIKTEVPDFSERAFYVSGSHSMVTAFEKMLQGLGISKSQIKTDFFPGLV